MEHGVEAQCFSWTEVKDMNSCRGKSRTMLFHGFFILMEQTHIAWCQRRRELLGTCTLSRRSI
ncbi:hypothetical protein C4D60_Mb07t12280 [Musa balbisiana]|uniref:Uncharacterized protein n=1 Tax=Musa balbisiana TaxID=52838 RepID=A0A4S8JF02_MUSBA|nr:hypothetical protein C4D60_Mb07t12280 [Musa balbisiana]